MALSFQTGIKLVAGISVIMAAILLGGTSWVFGTQMIDLDEKINSSGLPIPSKRPAYHTNEYNYTKTLKDLKFVWQKNQPILATCSAIAMFAGFIQLTVSLLIVFSDSKSIKRRVRIWMITHFIVFLVLLICLLSAFLTRLNHGLDMKSWSEILDSFAEILKNMNPKKDFSRILSFFRTGTPVYYGVVVSDQMTTMILFCVGVCVMHNYRNYEPQD